MSQDEVLSAKLFKSLEGSKHAKVRVWQHGAFAGLLTVDTEHAERVVKQINGEYDDLRKRQLAMLDAFAKTMKWLEDENDHDTAGMIAAHARQWAQDREIPSSDIPWTLRQDDQQEERQMMTYGKHEWTLAEMRAVQRVPSGVPVERPEECAEVLDSSSEWIRDFLSKVKAQGWDAHHVRSASLMVASTGIFANAMGRANADSSD